MAQPDFRVRVIARAALRPTEDPAKLRNAVENILGECRHDVEEAPRSVRATSDDVASIRVLHDQLRDRHVRAAARRLLLMGRERDKSTVILNRQAAYAGVIVLCGSESESPLGPIYLTIESERVDQVIEWLTGYPEG
jgi:uncharacterized protein